MTDLESSDPPQLPKLSFEVWLEPPPPDYTPPESGAQRGIYLGSIDKEIFTREAKRTRGSSAQ